MGRIKNGETGEERLLPEHAVLGRAPSCDIHLREAKASSEHAVLRWTDESWRIIDLGSRNGTWIAGRKLDTGESVNLDAGAIVSFGTVGETWQLIDADEPMPFVRGIGGDTRIIDGQIALPDDDDPQLIISRGAGGEWFAEHDGEVQVVVDRELLHVAGTWRLLLTSTLPHTEVENELLSDAVVLIQHDRTEECIKVTLNPRSSPSVDLGVRAHHIVLLELARVRLEDRAAGITLAREGWIHRDDLSARLALDVKHVNIMIYRLRRQLADMGVLDFTNIIERQAGLGILRLGSAFLEVAGE
jgi:hypothetical protein